MTAIWLQTENFVLNQAECVVAVQLLSRKLEDVTLLEAQTRKRKRSTTHGGGVDEAAQIRPVAKTKVAKVAEETRHTAQLAQQLLKHTKELQQQQSQLQLQQQQQSQLQLQQQSQPQLQQQSQLQLQQRGSPVPIVEPEAVNDLKREFQAAKLGWSEERITHAKLQGKSEERESNREEMTRLHQMEGEHFTAHPSASIHHCHPPPSTPPCLCTPHHTTHALVILQLLRILHPLRRCCPMAKATCG